MPQHSIYDSGLSVVYESQNAVVDIIFVHGLQGHPFRTWAYEKTDNADASPRVTKKKKRTIVPHRLISRFQSKPNSDNEENNRKGTQDLNSEGPSKNESAVFWPRDLLPKECPNSRILTWGYDTMVTKYMTGLTNKSNIFAQGKSLLFALGRERVPDRPLFLIAHSLGGIVVKEMLASSFVAEEPELKNIVASTAAVIFFGTPHRGSKDMAGAGEIARKVASILMMDTNSAMLDALGLKTSDLERCQESFSRLWREYGFRVKTFQEGFPLAAFNLGLLNEKVVPDYSSTLGDSRERAEPLDANHMQMCRISGPTDPNYRKVAGEIRVLYCSVANIKNEAKNSSRRVGEGGNGTGIGEISMLERVCIRSLCFAEMQNQQNTIDLPIDSTCAWLQNNNAYRAWLQCENIEDHHGLIWIKGKPGSGKSTLMKAALDRYLVKPGSSRGLVASFFFSGKGVELERTAIGFLRSMTYQLLTADANIRQLFLNMFQSTVGVISNQLEAIEVHKEPLEFEGRLSITWRKEQLRRFLQTVYRQPFAPQTIWFVDALDECEQRDAREVAYFVRDLTTLAFRAGNSLQVCLSSRQFGSITVEKCPEIFMENFNNEDICHYVRNRFSIAGMTEGKDPARLERVIMQRSSGVFLWVKLVVDLLLAQREQGANLKSMEARLLDLPDALEELFAEMLRTPSQYSFEDRLISVRLFQWVVFALQPLSLREWHHILAFIRRPPPRSISAWEDSDFYTGYEGHLDDDKLERQIRHFSGGLVEVRLKTESPLKAVLSGSLIEDNASVRAGAGSLDLEQGDTRLVQVIHESVREFFLRKDGFCILEPALGMQETQLGHVSIMNTCLDYIKIEELDGLVEARGILARKLAQMTRSMQNSRKSYQAMLSNQEPMSRLELQVSPTGSVKVNVASDRDALSRRGSVASFGSAASGRFGQPPELLSYVDKQEMDDKGALAQLNFKFAQDDQELQNYRTEAFMEEQLESPGSSVSKFSNSLLRKSSKASSIGRTQLLEADMPLFFYSIITLFHHAALAEKDGADPATIINLLIQSESSLWLRWVYLSEDLNPDTELVEYCVTQNLTSWVKYLLEQGEDPSYVFYLSIIEESSAIAELTILYDMNQTHTANSKLYCDLLDHSGFGLNGLEAYLFHVENLIVDGKITHKDLMKYVYSFNSEGDYSILLQNHLQSNSPRIADESPQLGATSIPVSQKVRLISNAGLIEPLLTKNENQFEHRQTHDFTKASTDEKGAEEMLSYLCSRRPPSLTAIQSLLETGVDSNTGSIPNAAPLHIASSINTQLATSLAKLLLSHGAFVDLKDYQGRTPLYLAVSCYNQDLSKELIASGADVNTRDSVGRSPLHVLASLPRSLLIGHHSLPLPSSQDKDPEQHGQKPLISPTIGKELPKSCLLEILLAHGADVDARDNSLRTAVHIAASMGNDDIIETLLRYGADVNAFDICMQTPLHHACSNIPGSLGDLDPDPAIRSIEKLVKAGSNIWARDQTGESSMDIAFRLGFHKAGKLLQILASTRQNSSAQT